MGKKPIHYLFIYKRILTILLGTITIHALFKNKYGFTVLDHQNMRNRADKEKIVDHSAGHNSAGCHQIYKFWYGKYRIYRNNNN